MYKERFIRTKVSLQVTRRNQFFYLPAKVKYMLKLEKGDELDFEYDKETDVITLKKVKK